MGIEPANIPHVDVEAAGNGPKVVSLSNHVNNFAISFPTRPLPGRLGLPMTDPYLRDLGVTEVSLCVGSAGGPTCRDQQPLADVQQVPPDVVQVTDISDTHMVFQGYAVQRVAAPDYVGLNPSIGCSLDDGP